MSETLYFHFLARSLNESELSQDPIECSKWFKTEYISVYPTINECTPRELQQVEAALWGINYSSCWLTPKKSWKLILIINSPNITNSYFKTPFSVMSTILETINYRQILQHLKSKITILIINSPTNHKFLLRNHVVCDVSYSCLDTTNYSDSTCSKIERVILWSILIIWNVLVPKIFILLLCSNPFKGKCSATKAGYLSKEPQTGLIHQQAVTGWEKPRSFCVGVSFENQ